MAQQAGRTSRQGVLRPQQVCARLEIQPYQLKFWETEFPQLGRLVGPKREYDARAVALAGRIRALLLDERLNLDEARARLGKAGPARSGAAPSRRGDETSAAPSLQGKGGDSSAHVRKLEQALAEARAALDEQARRHEKELEQFRTSLDAAKARLKTAEQEAAQSREALADARREIRSLRARLGQADRRAAAIGRVAEEELDAVGEGVRALESDLAELLLAMSRRVRGSDGAGQPVRGRTASEAPGAQTGAQPVSE